MAWQDHLSPRAKGAPTVVSLFAGCGGSSLGYSMAGYRELLAVDFDAHSCETLRANFPGVIVHHGDISELTDEQALYLAGIVPRVLDVLDGSPPCQGFSSAGKREFDDPRNSLFLQFARLLRAFAPKAFVMENVKGMVQGKMKLIFRDVFQELESCGYKVAAKLLDAKYHGVPQCRERVVFIGVRSDLHDMGAWPIHPEPRTVPVTVREAWARMPDEHGDVLTGPAALLAPHVRPGTGNGQGKYSLPLRGTTAGFGLYRLHWDRPCVTIPRLSLKSSSPLIHPDRDERITIAQAKRLASFPDEFALEGTFDQQWARIGNSVPPLMMRDVALAIKRDIL